MSSIIYSAMNSDKWHKVTHVEKFRTSKSVVKYINSDEEYILY